ncbi:MAG: RES family NAD+ phosphorylase [Pirellulales bacterium]|nr:RES family NAD+ phosphorylase [Pirellulales bacterium]
MLVGIEVRLQRVLNLTDGKIRQHLGVSEERMLEADWQTVQAKNGEGLTQAIGRLAWEAKIEALLVSSARFKKENNLVIFPDQLSKRSLLQIINRQELPEPR